MPTIFRIKNFLILVLYILFPSKASASLFNPPLTDRSVEYLGKIFGGNIGGIQLGADVGSSGFLGNLFQNFNAIVLTVAVVILSYSSILSVVNTAQDGEVMGKKWSSVWIPLRSAIGLLLLAPIPGSGYSLIQVTIVWIVLNGVGAADLVWNLVVDHLSKGVQFTSTVSPTLNTILQQKATKLATAMLRSAVCNKIFEKNLESDVFAIMQANMGTNFVEDDITSATVVSGSLKFGANSNQYAKMKNVCGQFNIKVTYDSLMDNVISSVNDRDKINIAKAEYEIKKAAIQGLLNSTDNFARDIVYSLPSSINLARLQKDELLAILDENLKFDGFLADGILSFVNLMNSLNPEQLAIRVGANLKSNNQSNLDSGYVAASKAIGWILAGSYYYNFSKFGTSTRLLDTALYEDPSIDSAIIPGLIGNGNSSVTYNSSFHPNVGTSNVLTQQTFTAFSQVLTDAALSNLFKVPQQMGNLSGGGGILTKSPWEATGAFLAINPIAFAILLPMYQTVQGLVNNLFNIQYNNQDPLLVIAICGLDLMKTAEWAWIGISIGMFFGSMLSGMMSACSPTFLMLLSSAVSALPVIIGVLGMGWVLGALMSIYMPLIPFMIFAMTALSWIISVIESIVAAPIVALGLISPSQDELGAVKPALGMIASIFMKPTLTLMGLLFASKLFKIAIAMINEGFKNTTDVLNRSAGQSLFGWIGLLSLFCGFVMALEHKCYSLIHHLPDKILSWIGVSGEQTDVSAVKKSKGSFDKYTEQFKQQAEGSTKGHISNFGSKMNEKQKDS